MAESRHDYLLKMWLTKQQKVCHAIFTAGQMKSQKSCHASSSGMQLVMVSFTFGSVKTRMDRCTVQLTNQYKLADFLGTLVGPLSACCSNIDAHAFPHRLSTE